MTSSGKCAFCEKSIDIKYDAEKLEQEAQRFIDDFKAKMKKIAGDTLGDLYSTVVPHLESDTWTNYREFLRIELEHEYKYSKFKDEWATNFRRAVFVENREEISKLIESDILKRIKFLESLNHEPEQFSYAPGGNKYQDLVKKLEFCKETLKRLAEGK